MTQYNGFDPYESTAHGPPASGGSLIALFALPIVVIGLLWAATYPLLAASIAAGALVTAVLLKAGLAALARRLGGRIREIDVPGFGTVRFRVTPR